MAERQELLSSIAETVADYRAGELEKPTPDHVERWLHQFDDGVQLPLLREMDHVLKNTYFDRAWVARFLQNLLKNPKLAGAAPSKFWKDANFLNIQQNGHSQEDMLKLLGESLEAQFGLRLAHSGSTDGPYIYLDDVLFSGSRVGNDLSAWLVNSAPQKTTVHLLLIAVHGFGEYKVRERIKNQATAAKKEIDLEIWRAASFENRKAYSSVSEVLWPAVLPDDVDVKTYLATEKKFPFEPRKPGGKLEHELFSSEEGRQLLERELLLAGVRIRSWCQNPSPAMRPLGFSPFGLGFGSMIVTFRNCPNNCPLALWWGDPSGTSAPLNRWYPLFPRKTYAADMSFDGFGFKQA